jgi:hypothetical protein
MQKSIRATLLLCIVMLHQSAAAAVGCTLTNPAQDLKYLYPTMTSYREEAQDLPRRSDGKQIYEGLRARIGDDLDAVYEAYDTPYTLYRVFADETLIGLVHGVNVPGQGGVIQVFVSVDPATTAIQSFFFQRIESPAAAALRKKTFRNQFTGLTLADFYKHDFYVVAEPTNDKDRIAAIKPDGVPSAGMVDYQATIRGLRKNLVLLDVFAFDRRSDLYWDRSQQALQQRELKQHDEATQGK